MSQVPPRPIDAYVPPPKVDPKVAKPRKPLRKVSKKRAMLNAMVNPGRKGLVLLAGKCMLCHENDAVDCHEMCRGAYREECLSHPRLQMALCRLCHDMIGDTKEWPIERQIAARIYWEMQQTITEACQVLRRADAAIECDGVLKYLTD